VAAGRPARTLLRIDRADVRVDGHPVLHDVGFRVREGENWAVVGGNGAGKSTLLRLAVGDEQAMPGGKVSRLGLGSRASVWEVKARVGLVTPELQARFRADIHAEEVVLSGFTSSVGIDFAPAAGERRAAARALRRTGAAHLAGRRIHSLSYGELRRLLVARALVRDPELLVLDEPMNGLDRGAREWLVGALDRLARQGVTLLLATHHRGELPPAITHELELRDGRVAYRGPRR
jgi:molybdate transport system ATP-binding protein